jgi:hypothetical protein
MLSSKQALSSIYYCTVLVSTAIAVAILSSTITLSSIVTPVYGFDTNYAVSNTKRLITNYNYNRNSVTVLSLSPMEIIDVTSVISTKYHVKETAALLLKRAAPIITKVSHPAVRKSAHHIAVAATTRAEMQTTVAATAAAAAATAANTINPDLQAQVLADSSFALMEFPTFLPDIKTSKLRVKYAQLIGRLLVLGIGFLPHHSFHPEELAIQLYLLGGSLKPIIRSIKLFRCITSSNCNADECELDYDNLDNFGLTGGEFECTYENNNEANDQQHDPITNISTIHINVRNS